MHLKQEAEKKTLLILNLTNLTSATAYIKAIHILPQLSYIVQNKREIGLTEIHINSGKLKVMAEEITPPHTNLRIQNTSTAHKNLKFTRPLTTFVKE